MNNYEKIKNMKIGELAEFLLTVFECKKCPFSKETQKIKERYCRCKRGVVLWLQQESENND